MKSNSKLAQENRCRNRRERLKPFTNGRADAAEATESGRISILVLGLAVLLIAVLTVGLVITNLHLQRRQLFGCADLLAVSAAQVVAEDEYFLEGELAVLEQRAREVAEQRLRGLRTAVCHVGEEVEISNFRIEGDQLELAVSTVPQLPVLSRYMSFLTERMEISVATLVKVTKSRSVEE